MSPVNQSSYYTHKDGPHRLYIETWADCDRLVSITPPHSGRLFHLSPLGPVLGK